MDVIVVGYGKIGRIKAFIWKSLGRRVNVYDVNADKQKQATDDGFALYDANKKYDDLIVDISTPASFHLQSLEWVLQNIQPQPRAVLIEKPLASDLSELQLTKQLLIKPENADFAKKIAVNESYFLSSALKYIADDILQNGAQILRVEAELSKNRLEDVANGRFVDEQLGSLGIELPHMIAMVQALDYNLGSLNIEDVAIYRKGDNPHNEGFAIKLSTTDTVIVIKSYLGDFRLQDNQPQPNKMIRTLYVKTDQKDYFAQFDPVEGLERYKSKITITQPGAQPTELVIDDNHLARHLEKISKSQVDAKLNQLLSPDNSMQVSELMFNFKNLANYHDLS